VNDVSCLREVGPILKELLQNQTISILRLAIALEYLILFALIRRQSSLQVALIWGVFRHGEKIH